MEKKPRRRTTRKTKRLTIADLKKIQGGMIEAPMMDGICKYEMEHNGRGETTRCS